MFRQLSKKYLFSLVMLAGVLIGGYFFTNAGMDSITKIRQLERVPPSKIGALLNAEANVTARAEIYKHTVISPYSKTPSLYYHYTREVEEKDSDGDTSWRVVEESKKSVDFYLLDETGRAIVNTSSAEIEWKIPLTAQVVKDGYRYTEWRLEPGDSVFVFGMSYRDAGQIGIDLSEEGEFTAIISTQSESEVRSEMGAESLLKIWIGIALLAMSVYFFCYIFKIHRLMAYLGLLSFVLFLILSDLGLVMMRDDLQSAQQRYQKQQAQALQVVKKILSQHQYSISGWNDLGDLTDDKYPGLPQQTKIQVNEIQVNLGLAREQLLSDLSAKPEQWLLGVWGINMPQAIPMSDTLRSEISNRLALYQITKLSKDTPIVFLSIAVLLSVVSAYWGIKLVKLKRYIENLPTTTTAGVVFGVNEVKGKLVLAEEDALQAPLTKQQCAWYYYLEEEKRGSGKDSKWVTVDEQSKKINFYCEDEQGRISIDADKADIMTTHVLVKRSAGRRYTEKRLEVGDPLYVIGYAGMKENINDNLTLQYFSQREPFIISNLSESEVMLAKARKGIFSLNVSFSSVVLASLLISGMAGDFAPVDFLFAAMISPLFMLVIMLVLHYNDLVFLRKRVERNWSNISVSLKKRMSLLPDIEQVVKKYAAHEAALIEELTLFRRQYNKGFSERSDINDLLKSEKSLGIKINMLQEAYPELKSDRLIMRMMDMLSIMENEVMYMRAGYNDAVEVYNTRIASVPDVLYAKLFGFNKKEFIKF